MRSVLAFALLGLSLSAFGRADAHSRSCASFNDAWYHVERKTIGLSSPIIDLDYRDGALLRDGRRIERSRLLDQLRKAAALNPHPRVMLTLRRADCLKARAAIRQIERTGICKESGCLYELHR